MSLRTTRLGSAGGRLFDSAGLPIGENIPGGTFELRVDFEPETATECGMIVSNALGDRVSAGYEVTGQRVFVDRSRSGLTDFGPDFPGCHGTPLYSAPPLPGSKAIAMHVFVDRSSVEVFVNDGHVVLTEQVFPRSPFNRLELYCRGGHAQITHCECWGLKPAHSFDRAVQLPQTERRMKRT
jgi:fructan beta-fructosidase